MVKKVIAPRITLNVMISAPRFQFEVRRAVNNSHPSDTLILPKNSTIPFENALFRSADIFKAKFHHSVAPEGPPANSHES